MANFKPEMYYRDVFDRDVSKMPYVDIYSAGFPCQTFSTAGKRDGFDDDRGIVFIPICRYIEHKKPKICILENVKSLVTHDHGNSFATILKYLQEIKSYNVYWTILSPDEINWPHHRPRVFIICIRNDIQHSDFLFPAKAPLTIKASQLLDSHKILKPSLTPYEMSNLHQHFIDVQRKFGDNIHDKYYFMDIGASPAFGKPMYEIVPCLKASRSKYYISKLKRKLTVREVEKIQGFPAMNVVVSDSQYLKQLGNSICVPVVEAILSNIFDVVTL